MFQKRVTMSRQAGSRIINGKPSDWFPLTDEQLLEEVGEDALAHIRDAYGTDEVVETVVGTMNGTTGRVTTEYRHVPDDEDRKSDQPHFGHDLPVGHDVPVEDLDRSGEQDSDDD